MKNLSIRKSSLAVVAMLGVGSPAFGQAQGASAQGQQWQIDYGEYRCTLSRRFGETAQATLGIRIVPGDETADLIIVNPSWERGASLPDTVEVVFRPSGTRLGVRASSGQTRSSENRFMRISGAEPRFFALFAAASGMSIEAEGRVLLSVDLPRTGEAMTALRTCHDDLLRSWGVDPAVLAGLRRQPVPLGTTGRLLTSSEPLTSPDPNSAFVVIRYTIGTDGRVIDCNVVHFTGLAGAGPSLCGAARERARYEPAIGPDGREVAVQTVRTTTILRRPSGNPVPVTTR